MIARVTLVCARVLFWDHENIRYNYNAVYCYWYTVLYAQPTDHGAILPH